MDHMQFLNDPFEDRAEKHRSCLIREESAADLHISREDDLYKDVEKEFDSILRSKNSKDASVSRVESPMEFELRVGHVSKVVKELGAEYSQYQDARNMGSIVEDSTRDDGTFASIEPGSWSLGSKESYLALDDGSVPTLDKLEDWMQYSRFYDSMTEDGMRDLNSLSQVVRTDVFVGKSAAELLLASKNNPDGPCKRRLLCIYPPHAPTQSSSTSEVLKNRKEEMFNGNTVDEILRQKPEVGKYNASRPISLQEREHVRRFALPAFNDIVRKSKPSSWRTKHRIVGGVGGAIGDRTTSSTGIKEAWESSGFSAIPSSQGLSDRGSGSGRFWRGKNVRRLFGSSKLKKL